MIDERIDKARIKKPKRLQREMWRHLVRKKTNMNKR